MKFITTADDFGFDEDTVAETIACVEEGVIKNVSIMAGMPAVEAALGYAKGHPELCCGVHLTFVGDGVETAISRADSVRDLTTSDGKFLSARAARMRALLGRVSPAQIAREAEAQIARVVDAGVRVEYVDGHKHMHKLPAFREALKPVLNRFGIRRMRGVQNVFLGASKFKSPTFWVGGRLRQGIAGRYRSTDRFFMSAGAPDGVWAEALAERAGQANWPGVLEVGVHPGTMEPWRAAEAREIRRFTLLADEKGWAHVDWREI